MSNESPESGSKELEVLPLTRRFLGNIPGRREVHAVSTIQEALVLDKKFKKELRILKYRGVAPNPNPSTHKDPLRWIAVWDGPDASTDYFNDPRYNMEEEFEIEVDPIDSSMNEELPDPPISSYTHDQIPQPRTQTRYTGNEQHRHFRRSRRQDWSGW